MATTDFGSLSSMQKRVWSQRVWNAGRDMSFWFSRGFVGTGTQDATKPVHLITELTPTERGDRVVLPLVQDLEGDGVVGDRDLEGNEESLVNDDIEVNTDQLRNAVKSRGRMSEQQTVIRFRAQARDKLAYWLGDKIDELMFLTATGRSYSKNIDNSDRPAGSQLSDLSFAGDVTSPTTNRVLYAGGASGTGSLTDSDTMNWNLLVDLCTLAKRKRIKPVRMNGQSYYCVIMSPEQARDLKQDANYQTIVSRAGERGQDNPLFKGAFAVVDGLILHEHNKVCTNYGNTSGSGQWGSGNDVAGAIALLKGAQAMGFARIGDPSWDESDNQDYGNREGVAYGRIIGMRKPRFKSIYDNQNVEDFSIIACYTAAQPAANP